MNNWTMQRLLLLLAPLFLAGCVQENSITIKNDGRVSFESVVTEVDDENKIRFDDLERAVAKVVSDLQQHKWTADVVWTSKERPYRAKVTGSGKLADVVGATGVYLLRTSGEKQYQVSFPSSGDNDVRVRFKSDNGVTIVEGSGKSVHEFTHAAPGNVYTINFT